MLPATQPEWIATTATVTTCRYQFARMNTLTLGMGTGDRFRITFDYYAHGRLYSGEFQSRVAIPQNEKISLRYNPLNPEQNSRSRDELDSGRSPIYVVGIVGSILLSVAWLAIIRGCR